MAKHKFKISSENNELIFKCLACDKTVIADACRLQGLITAIPNYKNLLIYKDKRAIFNSYCDPEYALERLL